MFTFLIHSSQVGWSVILDLLDQGIEMEGRVNKKFGCKSVDDNCVMYSIHTELQQETLKEKTNFGDQSADGNHD